MFAAKNQAGRHPILVKISKLDDHKKPLKGTSGAFRSRGLSIPSEKHLKRDSRAFSHLSNEKLLERIDSEGKDFVSAPSEETLQVYRSLVKEAIERAVSSGLKMAREHSFSTSPKLFTIITKIDAALLDLAEAVRASQNGRMKIAGIVEEIKGLVADIIC